MLFNQKYGRIGMVSLPYYWIFELFGPMVELLGYVIITLSFAFGILDVWFFLAYLLFSLVYGVLLSFGSLLLEETTFRKYPNFRELMKLFLFAFLENFGYRQINAYFRIVAVFQYRKSKHSWGEIKRKGFGK